MTRTVRSLSLSLLSVLSFHHTLGVFIAAKAIAGIAHPRPIRSVSAWHRSHHGGIS